VGLSCSGPVDAQEERKKALEEWNRYLEQSRAQEAKEKAEEAAEAAAERVKWERRINPETDPRYDLSYHPSAGEAAFNKRQKEQDRIREAAQRDEEKKKRDAETASDRGRSDRFLNMRGYLTVHGKARSDVAELLVKHLTPRDRQILKRHGLTWPRRGPTQQDVMRAIDDWAKSSDPYAPDAATYDARIESAQRQLQAEYNAVMAVAHKNEAIANSGPMSLAGRVVGTAIGGERGGDLGAAIGGLGDATLAPYAEPKLRAGDVPSAAPEDAIHGPPPERVDPVELQPDRPAGRSAPPEYAPSAPLADTQPGWAFEGTQPPKTEPAANDPGTVGTAAPKVTPAAPRRGAAPPSYTSPAVPVTPDDVRAAYQRNPASITKSKLPFWHEFSWRENGGQGPAPIAYRTDKGVIRVDPSRWPTVGKLSDINPDPDLPPK
jgi:hypothetical protein